MRGSAERTDMCVSRVVSSMSVCQAIVTICASISHCLSLFAHVVYCVSERVCSLSCYQGKPRYKIGKPSILLTWSEKILESSMFLLPSFYQHQHNCHGNKLLLVLEVLTVSPLMHSLCASTPSPEWNASQLSHHPHWDSISAETRRPCGESIEGRELPSQSLTMAELAYVWNTQKESTLFFQSLEHEIWPYFNDFKMNLMSLCSLPADFVYLSHVLKKTIFEEIWDFQLPSYPWPKLLKSSINWGGVGWGNGWFNWSDHSAHISSMVTRSHVCVQTSGAEAGEGNVLNKSTHAQVINFIKHWNYLPRLPFQWVEGHCEKEKDTEMNFVQPKK